MNYMFILQATVVMPNGRTSTSMEDPFNITAVPDDSVPKPADEDLPKVTRIYLNSCFPALYQMIFQTNTNKNLIQFGNYQENCVYATIGGSCFRKKTYVELFMSLPKNVWKLGETIPVHVECSVKGGSSDVDKVAIKSKISPYIFLYVTIFPILIQCRSLILCLYDYR